jgi:hypothetical protein
MPVFPPQFTGTKLSSALLPSADFPGFSVYPAGTYNTGSGVGDDQVSYYLDLMSCADYAKNFGNPGFGETALALNMLDNGSGQWFNQEIMQFTAPAGAMDYLAHTEQLLARCPSFSATLQEGTNHFRVQVSTAPPVSGHQAILVKQSTASPETVEDQLFVADGADVCFVADMGFGAPMPPSPSLRSLAAKLVSKASALH